MEKKHTKSIAVISILIPPKLCPRFNLASCGHKATGGCGLRAGSKREIGDLGCSIRQWVHVGPVDVDGLMLLSLVFRLQCDPFGSQPKVAASKNTPSGPKFLLGLLVRTTLCCISTIRERIG